MTASQSQLECFPRIIQIQRTRIILLSCSDPGRADFDLKQGFDQPFGLSELYTRYDGWHSERSAVQADPAMRWPIDQDTVNEQEVSADG